MRSRERHRTISTSGAFRYGSTTSALPTLLNTIRPLLAPHRYSTVSRATMPDHFRRKLKNLGRRTGKYLQTAAWQTCSCLLWIVCSPCVCCMILLLPNQSRASRHVGRIEPVKPMVPWPRRRALSITSKELRKEQTTCHQAQSAFMTRLPLELRRMIYKEALRDDPIHLMLLQGKLKARRCGVSCCTCCTRHFRDDSIVHVALPLLRTCRRM